MLRFKSFNFKVVQRQTAASTSTRPCNTGQHLFTTGSPNPICTNPFNRSTHAPNFNVSIGHVSFTGGPTGGHGAPLLGGAGVAGGFNIGTGGSGGRSIGGLIGGKSIGGLIGGKSTGGLIGGRSTGGLTGGSSTGGLIGGRSTGGLMGGRSTGGLIGGRVTGGNVTGGNVIGGLTGETLTGGLTAGGLTAGGLL